MKKIILLFLCIACFLFSPVFAAEKDDCQFTGEISQSLDNCLRGSQLVPGGGDAKIEGGFQDKVRGWVQGLALFFGVFAVGSIVYGSLLLTLSIGEEEKVKKAKDVIKWGILGFIGLISASAIILVVVNVMYAI